VNEITILMQLLSKKLNLFEIGSTKEEILNALNIRDKNKAIYFQDLIINLSNYIEPLGLQIRFNPLNSRWFTVFDSDVSDLLSANPFEGKPRLAATLFCTLVCCLKNLGTGKIHEIQKLRKKKGIIEDLKDLRKMGYLELDKNVEEVRLSPLIGYQLDFEKLFIKLALKFKK